MSVTVVAGRVFDGSRVHSPGVVHIDGGRIVGSGPLNGTGSGAGPQALDLGDLTLTPGLIDVHCHGGGGESFGVDPKPGIALHRSHGVTSLIASLVSQSLPVLHDQLTMLEPLVAAGELAGAHLEGPWIAPEHKGAHPIEALRNPETAEVAAMLEGPGTIVRMVTIAPELPGGLDAVGLIAKRGRVAAVGHTSADLDTTCQAIAAGATGATHLFNAMPGLHHRHPGPILACTADQRVWLELIADGIHVDMRLVAEVMRRYPGRVVLITDAMAATGRPDGEYLLGDLPVVVSNGVAHLAGTDTIAGSTLTLDRAVRNTIRAGVGWQQVLAAATLCPARYLGLGDVGRLTPGAWADLVVWDDDWQVRRVMRRGRWLDQAAGEDQSPGTDS